MNSLISRILSNKMTVFTFPKTIILRQNLLNYVWVNTGAQYAVLKVISLFLPPIQNDYELIFSASGSTYDGQVVQDCIVRIHV
jgi:hypothetical protein